MTFGERVRDLERCFGAFAERDGSVYLPNFMPTGPVDYVFIGMEPSLGAWASSLEKAKAKIAAGFRNFMWSMEDFILHTSARHYLCEPGQTYYVTDISKGAMSVKRANLDRTVRYERWFPLLVQEIDLVAKPDAIPGALDMPAEPLCKLSPSAKPWPRTSALAGSRVRFILSCTTRVRLVGRAGPPSQVRRTRFVRSRPP